jgi:hypothetical protein
MRTKNYFPESEITHMWAHQTREHAYREGGNHYQIYFEGKTIYSYGRHFPIAVLFGKKNEFVAFTTRTYSNTTAKHIWAVKWAISHFPSENIIYCKNPDYAVSGTHDGNLMDFEYTAKDIYQNIARARKPMKYFDEIAQQKAMFDKYCKAFKVRVKAKDFPFLHTKADQATIDKVKLTAKKEAENRAKREAAALKEAEKQIAAWRDCKTYRDIGGESDNYVSFPQNSLITNTYLRILPGGMVETSKGIKFSLDAGKRFYSILSHIKNNGGCSGDCGEKKILDFKISAVNNEHLVIGCHDILWTEANEIAKQAGWIK